MKQVSAFVGALALGAGALVIWALRGQSPSTGADGVMPPTPSAATSNTVTSEDVVRAQGSSHQQSAPPLDPSVWKVPVYSDDPVRGPNDALVTIVAFSEFEAPFCKRAAKTLEEILAAYPDDVRLVWKDNPLPFNQRARPAALLGRLAFAERGSTAFWDTHDLLFAAQPKLADEDLNALAGKLGIAWGGVKAAVGDVGKIDQSIELGGDVQARGTPHFFINGRRLAGAQPLETFRKLIDEQLASARALVAQGTPRDTIYEAVIKDGKRAAPLSTKDLPPPDAFAPARGEPTAKVAIQQFAEFPCTSCSRAAGALEPLEGEYRGRIKVVWRYLASPTDNAGLLVAQAAQEAFEQRGSQAFWLFHDRVLDAMERGGTLDVAALARIATETSIDGAKLKQALARSKHKKRILVDTELAARAGIASSPSFVVGRYYLTDNPPGPVFKKAINRALREAKREP